MAGSAPGRSCSPPAAAPTDPGVVPGGQAVEAEPVGAVQQAVELDGAVALDARVRRPPPRVLPDIGRHDGRSNSSVRLKTWWSIPSCWATRRASSTSATEQQPESDGPPHSLSVAPTTSWPCSTRSAAATEESTPPDIATSTRMGPVCHREHRDLPPAARSRSGAAATTAGTTASGAGHVVLGRPVAQREPNAPAASSGATPMAARTWLGWSAPLAQDEPPETQMPSRPQGDQQLLAFDAGQAQMQMPGQDGDAPAGTVR